MGCKFSDCANSNNNIKFDPAAVTTNLPEGYDYAAMQTLVPIIKDCAILSKSG